jgi:uncharacterized protein (DUF1778 family)
MRDEQKSVTFDTKEKEIIEMAAKKYGLNYSSFIRNACLKEAEKVLGGADDD